jgi:hypothetical protein
MTVVFTMAVALGAFLWHEGESLLWIVGVMVTLCYLPLMIAAWVRLIANRMRAAQNRPRVNPFPIFGIVTGLFFLVTLIFVIIEFSDISASKHFGYAAICLYLVLPVHTTAFLVSIIGGLAKRAADQRMRQNAMYQQNGFYGYDPNGYVSQPHYNGEVVNDPNDIGNFRDIK